MHSGFAAPRLLLAFLLLASASLALPACSPGAGEDPAEEADAGNAEASADAEVTGEGGDAEDAPKAFDPGSLPVSEAALGEFPYFRLPEGYHTKPRNESTQALGRFAFWHGAGYIEANGRIYQGNIQAVEGKVFSSAELTLAIEKQIIGMGGVLIADSVVPSADRANVLTRNFVDEYSKGLCWPTEPVRTYVVRSVGHDVWVHACTYGDIGGGWVIGDIPVPDTVDAPLPGSELVRALRETGKADLGLRFLPGAAAPRDPGAQVDALAGLMVASPQARLSIRGSAGVGLDAAGREALALARARHLHDALVAAGVDAGQLEVEASPDAGGAGIRVSYRPGT